MRHLKLFSLLSIPSVVLLVNGCGGNGSQTSSGPSRGGGQTTTIYVAGFSALPSGKAAELWQVSNGSSTPGITAQSFPNGSTASQTCGGMAVSGGNVYVAGYAWNATTGIIYAPTYWVNGTATPLPLPSGVTGVGASAEACGVVVSGSDVYVAGNVPTGTASTAAYWMNGALTELPTPSGMEGSAADAIAVSGSDVYVAGEVRPFSSNYYPAYWVNGAVTALPLPSGINASAVTAIAVSGSNVYMAGFGYTGTGDEYAVYWANGTATLLTLQGNLTQSEASTIAVSGSDVYVAGSVLNSAGYIVPAIWVNGTANTLSLPGSATEGTADSIVVSGGSVYVSGAVQYGAGEPIGDGQIGAAYWINGMSTALPIPSGATDSYNTGIAVTTQ